MSYDLALSEHSILSAQETEPVALARHHVSKSPGPDVLAAAGVPAGRHDTTRGPGGAEVQ